uniref:Protein containing Gly transf sug domain n=1 Tax=Rhipicephalus zambeziensis TaxID=60191 RepID=A0A224YRY1_9ACAR
MKLCSDIKAQLKIRHFYCLVALATILGMATYCVRYQTGSRYSVQSFYCWDRPVPQVAVEEHDVAFVPNIVHFVRLGDAPLSFIEVVSIRAAWLQQKPDSLMIHCDNCSATTGSEHWKHIKDIPRLMLSYVEKPETIFGIKISYIEHASDIVRIRVLRKYGGIYLDSDSYVVKSLDKYRRYETAIGWPPGQNIGNQIIVAHKRSKFLRLYYESYRKYRPDLWYYNGGELPTQEILGKNPHLVYRVPCDFGVHEHIVITLFEECNDDWRNFTAVHVFFRHRTHYLPADKFGPINFETVGRYEANFGKMARLVLTGSTKLGGSAVKNISLMSAENLDYSDGCGYLCRLMSLLTP